MESSQKILGLPETAVRRYVAYYLNMRLRSKLSMIPALLLLLWFPYYALYQNTRGLSAEATITAQNYRYRTVEFIDTSGRTIQTEIKLPKFSIGQFEPGNTITIYYDAADPAHPRFMPLSLQIVAAVCIPSLLYWIWLHLAAMHYRGGTL